MTTSKNVCASLVQQTDVYLVYSAQPLPGNLPQLSPSHVESHTIDEQWSGGGGGAGPAYPSGFLGMWHSVIFVYIYIYICIYIYIWPWGITYDSILGSMNIHLPPILMFTRGFLGFDPQPYLFLCCDREMKAGLDAGLPEHVISVQSTRFSFGGRRVV